MTITAKVVAHSRSPFHSMGVPDVTTFLLRYPRFIHAEVMTHRMFSRNASSSRAIPVARLIQDCLDDTAMPIHWGLNQPGMQAREEHDGLIYDEFCSPLDMIDRRYDGVTPQTAWLKARDNAIAAAKAFDRAGYHKQLVNRILEPFVHINVVVTATNYDNFFWLRSHEDAQPEIKALSDAMIAALAESKPRNLGMEEWHLPFVTDADRARVEQTYAGDGNILEVPVTVEELLQVSTSRCARTSYMTHDGRVPDFDEDLKLYQRLVGGEPLHASPTEHQARPDCPTGYYDLHMWENPELSGNLDAGWIQFRKTLPREHCPNYNLWKEKA